MMRTKNKRKKNKERNEMFSSTIITDIATRNAGFFKPNFWTILFCDFWNDSSSCHMILFHLSEWFFLLFSISFAENVQCQNRIYKIDEFFFDLPPPKTKILFSESKTYTIEPLITLKHFHKRFNRFSLQSIFSLFILFFFVTFASGRIKWHICLKLSRWMQLYVYNIEEEHFNI